MNCFRFNSALVFLCMIMVGAVLYGQDKPGHNKGERGNWGGGRLQQNNGRFYGKIVDASTGKGIEFAPVQLFQQKWDSSTQSRTTVLVNGQLTELNGDFSLDGLPVFGRYTLKITAIGYETIEIPVSFEAKHQQGTEQGPKREVNTASNEKDLGNIRLKINTTQLKEVVIDGSEPAFKLDIDKKVYNVDKNPVNSGGTAEDVMKNVPSLNVDIDGNVTLRNSSPQIFVDGRPTNLNLDQIPADAIESVEVISNPSAKYDASGGSAGIVNIVLKKNKQMGYNGNIRFGIDMRKRLNTGIELNVRQKKVNIFVNANLNQRKSIGYSETNRENLIGNPKTNVFQKDDAITYGQFAMVKGGLDYFIDNRNTITISQSYNAGQFNPLDYLYTYTDSVNSNFIHESYYNRNSSTTRNNANLGSALLYKHLFPTQGRELTADINYQKSKNTNAGYFETQNYFQSQALGSTLLQQQKGNGLNHQLTIQSDYVSPVSETKKIEAGLRASIQNYFSSNVNSIFNHNSNEYVTIPALTSNYQYINQVYAAYFTLSAKKEKFGYQTGLRVESSDYKGKLIDSGLSFHNQYPLSFFPSVFLSYALNEKNDFQLSYARRINRPNFFQLIPYVDYSDSLNLKRGNPDLRPEFTNSLEVNYQHTFNRSNNFILSTDLKNSTALITGFQVFEYNAQLNRSVVMNTFANANGSYAYGVEFTTKNALQSWLDLTANINMFNLIVDAGNLQKDLTNQQFTWFGKMNLNFKLPKNISYQLSGEYQSKSILPVGGGRGGQGGGFGGGGMGGPSSTVQGYVKPRYQIDMAIKYEFLKNKAANITLSVSDLFKMKKFDSYSGTDYFIQNTNRYRDQRFFRLNLSYRFGKFDSSLFKRKNTKNSESEDVGF